ncbi:hypothetical protein HYH03_015555 [Edaphochlamys debaryana]|uniref:Rubredoxin-like domain-containing protein n=1 Tax=Edaphochlamys debaryana TaxID=47281 RepID=A0A835XKY4_9CHLO|nr:hypothetical protein HYH03_015555 [Edaphochlamys debaryana]|eukprot:KAG2485746.1 hypothetical protein HYH03_015555 [Edaphochlamys debaryana]
MAAMQTAFSRSALKPALRGASSRSTTVAVSARSAVAAKGKAAGKEAMVCLQCGYLYDEKTPFEDVKAYACPVCNAPKRRFKALKGNVSRSNDPKSLAARKEKLRDQIAAEGGNADEGENELLLLAGASVVVTLGLFWYLTQ